MTYALYRGTSHGHAEVPGSEEAQCGHVLGRRSTDYLVDHTEDQHRAAVHTLLHPDIVSRATTGELQFNLVQLFTTIDEEDFALIATGTIFCYSADMALL